MEFSGGLRIDQETLMIALLSQTGRVEEQECDFPLSLLDNAESSGLVAQKVTES